MGANVKISVTLSHFHAEPNCLQNVQNIFGQKGQGYLGFVLDVCVNFIQVQKTSESDPKGVKQPAVPEGDGR